MTRPRITGALALLLAVALGACAPRGGVSNESTQALGGLVLRLATEPSPPRVGENALVVRVSDTAGRPVDGAQVDAVATMPAMGAMPAMESRGRMTPAGAGSYRVRYGLSMAGDWDVHLRVAAPGRAPVEGDWRISTMHAGIAWAGADSAGAGAAADGAITLDAAQRRAVGLATAPAAMRPLGEPIAARGAVVYDESRRAVVSPRYAGWVRTLTADFTGKPVRRGATLCTVDGPDLWSAQQEYLSALRFAGADSVSRALAFGGASSGPGHDAGMSLAEAARLRLLRWDVPDDVVRDIARRGEPRREIPLRAPASGVVVEKTVSAGSPFTAGQVLFTIVGVDPVWIEARVAESDLARVRVGQAATVRVPGEEAERRGRVEFVQPALDEASRTGVARVALANADGRLKPGMFVDVSLLSAPRPRLVVPDGAVVVTGTREVVFVAAADGTIVPRAVRTGVKTSDWTEIVEGLAAGERVVTTGNFLVSSDARFAAALRGR